MDLSSLQHSLPFWSTPRSCFRDVSVWVFADTVRTVTAAEPLARAPFTVQARKAPAACYYNAAADFAAIYDLSLIHI